MKHFNLLKKVSLVSAGNILNAGFGLVFLTAAAKVLSVTDFGRYALITTLLVFMSKIVDFGSNSVFVAQSMDNDNRSLLIHDFYVLKLALFIISSVLSLVILYSLGFRSADVIVIFLVGLLFYSVNVTLFAVFQSKEMFTHAILLNTVPAFLKALLGVLILRNIFIPSFTGIYAIFSLSIGLSFLLFMFVPDEFKKFSHRKGLKSDFLPILKNSSPAGISQLISQGWSAISNTIVKVSRGFTDVGVFYLADKIANVFSLISLSIFTVLLPQNARRKKENLPHDLQETVFLGVLVLFLAVGFISVSGIFIDKFFGQKFSGSLLVLDILVLSSAISAIHSFMENYFYVHDQTQTIMHVSLVKLVIFIVMAFILIPVMSLRGLALSQLISSVIGLFAVSYIISRHSSSVR